MDRNAVLPRVQRRVCRKTTYHALVCRNILFFLAGAVPDNFDVVSEKISINQMYLNKFSKLLLQSILPVVAEHNPAGASFRTWFQFIQNYLAGRLVAGSSRSLLSD